MCRRRQRYPGTHCYFWRERHLDASKECIRQEGYIFSLMHLRISRSEIIELTTQGYFNVEWRCVSVALKP